MLASVTMRNDNISKIIEFSDLGYLTLQNHG